MKIAFGVVVIIAVLLAWIVSEMLRAPTVCPICGHLIPKGETSCSNCGQQ